MMGLVLALLLSTDWVGLFPTVAKHVARVEIRKGDQTAICSAVVFEIDKDGFANAFTVAHCTDHQPNERIDITVNGRNAVALHSNSLLDLAVLRFRAKNETPIAVAPEEPPAGTEVAILGYGFGVEEIAAQFGYVAQSYNRETKTTWIAADLLLGDSGGALVDGQGRLVGINSRIYSAGLLGQSSHMAAVVTVSAIRDYIDAFNDLKKRSKQP